jgi:uncharacterized membrane protein YgcG
MHGTATVCPRFSALSIHACGLHLHRYVPQVTPRRAAHAAHAHGPKGGHRTVGWGAVEVLGRVTIGPGRTALKQTTSQGLARTHALLLLLLLLLPCTLFLSHSLTRALLPPLPALSCGNPGCCCCCCRRRMDTCTTPHLPAPRRPCRTCLVRFFVAQSLGGCWPSRHGEPCGAGREGRLDHRKQQLRLATTRGNTNRMTTHTHTQAHTDATITTTEASSSSSNSSSGGGDSGSGSGGTPARAAVAASRPT